MNETIAAISTPFGKGGIGIIRISGGDSIKLASRVFRGRKPVEAMASHTVSHGRIVDAASEETLDDVLLTVMKGPNSFTGEDVVEINCHGGTVVLLKVMDLILREGALPAQPGEFTKRAFINGRMDLSQAEAVIDIINAKTSESSRAAVEQLEGRLSEKIRNARGRLIGLIAHIEAVIDYPEHDLEDITGQQVYEGASEAAEQLEGILRSFERGRVIREGISAVIAGKPNVGKSSLLNGLSGKSRAIVTDIPGTTRDIIEEYIDIKGIPVRIVDTAGIRETLDPVERIGVEKASSALDKADLVLLLLDAAAGIDEEDQAIIERVHGKRVIFIINKTDAAENERVAGLEKELLGRLDGMKTGTVVLKVSVKNDEGLDALENTIAGFFSSGEIDTNNEVLLTNVRHKNLVELAVKSLRDAASAFEGGMPLDFITIDIRNAADYLGQITGESVSEDVISEIFSRFCVGK